MKELSLCSSAQALFKFDFLQWRLRVDGRPKRTKKSSIIEVTNFNFLFNKHGALLPVVYREVYIRVNHL